MPFRKHILRGKCLECGKAMSVDVLRSDKFVCPAGHASPVADIVDDMTWKIANRKRAHAEMEPLPAKSDRSGYARPQGPLAKLCANRAIILVEKLGKSEALRHAGVMLKSAMSNGNDAQVKMQMGLIAEIEAL